MTLRPLRPSQNTHSVDDSSAHHQGDANIQVISGESGPGPSGVSAPALSRTTLNRRLTCLQCRHRKVRCDGREGIICRNCNRLGFGCSFQRTPGKSPGHYALKLPEPRRRMQACSPCHVKKTRCDGGIPSCSNCVQRYQNCTYPAGKNKASVNSVSNSDEGIHGINERGPTSARKQGCLPQRAVDCGSRNSSPEQGMTDIAESSSLGSETAMEQIEDYFRYLYPLPSFAFLHKPTVIRRSRDGTIKEPLKLAICAVTSLHLQRSSLRHDLWVQRAEQLLIQQLGRPSVFHLQALLLVIRYRIESGEFPTAFMLAALAARTAVALRLNYEHSGLPYVAQEARRRLFWALYLLDDYFCVGLREFELCPEETIYLQLPCREEVFEAGQKCQTGMLQPSPSDDVVAMGLRGAAIRLTSTRRAIMRFNRRVSLDEEAPATIGDRIQQFEKALSGHQATLSPQRQYSVSNLISCRWPARLAMLHVSYHQCHCDMYRMFLNGYSEAAPSGVLARIRQQDCISMQTKCLQHAEEITRIIADFTNHCDASYLLERDAAVCAFESARLLMFGARLACASLTLEVAIHKARTISLQFITKYFPYSAATRPLREALEHLISSYSTRLTLERQNQTRTPNPGQRKETSTLSEPEPEPEGSTPRCSAKVSQHANARQRLSVQSLLLQSDFTDDSHDMIANPGPVDRNEAYNYHDVSNTHNTNRNTSAIYPYPYTSSNTDIPMSMTPSVPPVIPSRSGTVLQHPYSEPVPTQTQSQSHAQAQPSLRTQAPFSVPIDARRESAGLIHNPWMGFIGNEECYGLATGRDEDY